MFDKLSAELTMLSADRPKMFQGHEQHSEQVAFDLKPWTTQLCYRA
jgi:hypothetical protein